jgi:branched-chain amino acid transport system substrate-binding protein
VYTQVAKAYEADGGKLTDGQPPIFVNTGYDSVLALTEAIKAAGSTDPSAIRDGLEKLTSVDGSLGNFRFSAQEHSGFGPEDLTAIVLQDGVWKEDASAQ